MDDIASQVNISAESLRHEPDVRISIRSEIRRWITRWDLGRYYPEYSADVAVEEVKFDPDAIDDAQLVAAGEDATAED